MNEKTLFFLLLMFRLLVHVAGQVGKVAGQIGNLPYTDYDCQMGCKSRPRLFMQHCLNNNFTFWLYRSADETDSILV